jgi:hypothetical protein
MVILRSKGPLIAFLLATVLAAIAPVFKPGAAAVTAAGFPGWPASFAGRAITEQPLNAIEQDFAREFPGRFARFTDGQNGIILRWVAEPTRRLHPAQDCFKGLGYEITPLPVERDASGVTRGCFRATHTGETLKVCEVIRDAESGATWSDVSAWYWDALWGKSRGPWWSEVVAERATSDGKS